MSLKGILFDFDGVVIDSMTQHYDAWIKAFSEKNISFSKEYFFQLEGQGVGTIARMIGEDNGLSEQDTLEVISAKVRHYYKSVQIRFYDYFLEMLGRLNEKNIPMAVVTGGNKERVSRVIAEYLPGYFKDYITIDDVSNGKPHPEPFIKGAEKLALKPGQCIVVENAPLGIQAGIKAGCTVIAVKTTLSDKYLNKAHYVVDDFRMLEKKIEQLMF